MYQLTPKSIGFVLDPYPTMVQSTNILDGFMSEKSERQSYTHTPTQTDGADHSIVAHFVRGNYNKLEKLQRHCCQHLNVWCFYSVIYKMAVGCLMISHVEKGVVRLGMIEYQGDFSVT